MLLSLRNIRQSQEADCLAACALMILEYLGINVGYSRLLRLLGTGEPGTPFSNMERLRSLGVFVETGTHCDDRLLFEYHVQLGLPVVVAVATWPLPFWSGVDTDHAIVVVGLDENHIYVNDPYYDASPQIVENEAFLTAWSEQSFQYAIIGLVPPE